MINVVHVFDSNLIVAPEGEGVAEAGVAAGDEDAEAATLSLGQLQLSPRTR